MSRHALPAQRFGLRVFLAALALFLVAVPFGLLLTLVRAGWAPLRRLDVATASALHDYALNHPGYVRALRLVSDVGAARTYWPLFVVLALWLLWRRMPRLAGWLVITVALSGLLNVGVKAAVGRARPLLPDAVATAPGLSFPSGHAQSAMVTASVLLLLFLPVAARWARPYLGAAALAFVAAVGFSRIGLGVHYVSDVLGGYLLGAAWVAATTAAFRAWRVERRESPGQVRDLAHEGLADDHAQRITG